MTSSESLSSPPSTSSQAPKAISALTSLETLGFSSSHCRKVFQGTSSLVELQLCTNNIPVNHPNYLKIPLFLQYLKKKKIKYPLSKQPRCPRLQNSPLISYRLGSGTVGCWTPFLWSQTALVQSKHCKNKVCVTVPACSRLCPISRACCVLSLLEDEQGTMAVGVGICLERQ